MNTRFATTVPALILLTWLCSCDEGRSPTTGDLAAGNGTTGTHSDSPPDTISDPVSTQIYTPDFSVYGGTFFSPFSVELTAYTAGTTIYYTTDGSSPTTSSTRYTGPILITGSCTLSAIAAKDGKQSAISFTEYKIVDLSRTSRDPKVVGTWVSSDTESTSTETITSTSTVTFLAGGSATLEWSGTTNHGSTRTSSSHHGEGSWYTENGSLVTNVYSAGYGGDGAGTYAYRFDGTDLVVQGTRYHRK